MVEVSNMLKIMSTALCAALLLSAGQALPVRQALAADAVTLNAVANAHSWVNGKIDQQQLRNKVVLLDFYTFDCINCKHTEPNLRALYRETPRSELVIVGVHSPETPYERNRDNLLASLRDQGIAWPVAVDNDFAVWNSYGVQAWPTQLIFDRHGKLRATVVGEGQDDLIKRTIRQLIAER